jgi:hypothetical protein
LNYKNETVAAQALDKPRAFFLIASVGILIFCVAAFALKAVVHPERLARYTPPVIVHAFLMTSWLTVFALQAYMVRAGRIKMHRVLGAISPALTVTFIVSGFSIAYRMSVEFDFPEQLIGNAFGLVAFLALYVAALGAAAIGRFEAHKRLMLIAALSLLGPPLARYCNIIGIAEIYSLPAQIILVIAVPVGYDLALRKRIHAATAVGVGAFILFTILLIVAITSVPFVELVRERLLA